MNRLWCVGLVLAVGCGSKPGAVAGDDQPPPDAADVDACASCAGDTGTFVSAITGSDANPGTKAMPLKTIGAGIAAAKALGGAQIVFVGQGGYPEKVTLAEGISVDGGYECNAAACTWARDLGAFESTIANQDYEGVLAGATITQATLLDGFKIIGKDGAPPAAPGSVGVTIAGGSPTLRGNKILGGNVTAGGTAGADRSIGIAVRTTGAAAVVIENNDVAGGQASGISAAISLEAVSQVASLATVRANVLRGGLAKRSVGVFAPGARQGTLVVNNDITAGSSTGGASLGIEVSSRMTIDGNRIDADPATVGTCTTPTQWCAGIASESASVTITNNVVYGPKAGRSAGVYLGEFEVAAGEVILNANYVNGGGDAGSAISTTRTESAAVVVTIGTCNNCGFTGAVGRVRNNILDGGLNQNRFGVREDPAMGRTMSLEALEANDLVFSANLPLRNDTLYRRVSSMGFPTDIKALVQLNMSTAPPASKNKSADPQLDATWHLATASPCVERGRRDRGPGDRLRGGSSARQRCGRHRRRRAALAHVAH